MKLRGTRDTDGKRDGKRDGQRDGKREAFGGSMCDGRGGNARHSYPWAEEARHTRHGRAMERLISSSHACTRIFTRAGEAPSQETAKCTTRRLTAPLTSVSVSCQLNAELNAPNQLQSDFDRHQRVSKRKKRGTRRASRSVTCRLNPAG